MRCDSNNRKVSASREEWREGEAEEDLKWSLSTVWQRMSEERCSRRSWCRWRLRERAGVPWWPTSWKIRHCGNVNLFSGQQGLGNTTTPLLFSKILSCLKKFSLSKTQDFISFFRKTWIELHSIYSSQTISAALEGPASIAAFASCPLTALFITMALPFSVNIFTLSYIVRLDTTSTSCCIG